MATTTNYSWTTPDNTAYVKDGASAIRTLGSSVDTTLFTALGGAYPGLRLVKKQTIGSAVSSVAVTGAFSATYTNYKIIVSGGAQSADDTMKLQFGATTTGYYDARPRVTIATGAITANATNNGSSSAVGYGRSTGLALHVDIMNPFLTTQTQYFSNGYLLATNVIDTMSGFLNNSTSYTDFTLTPTSGTFTGGTIYVYGYGTS